MDDIDKWCGNCKYYVLLAGYCPSIEVCCKHRVRVVAEDGTHCYGWELDDLHVDDAVDRPVKEIVEDLFGEQ